MPQLEQRVISGKGILVIPPGDNLNKAKVLTLYCDVIRKPQQNYLSRKHSPPESFYGYMNLIRDGYVMQTLAIDYENQVWEFSPENSMQTLYAQQEAYKGILQTLVNLGIALGSPITEYTNNIAAWRHESRLWDTVAVQCFSDAGIRLTVISTPFQFAPSQSPLVPNLPQDAPTPPSPIPPGTPLYEAGFPPSEAYDGDTDQGFTVPLEVDVDPMPYGRPGTWNWTFKGLTTGQVFTGSASGFELDAPGIATNPNSACVNGTQYNIVATARGNARYSNTTSLSTCGTGAMQILTQVFTPAP